MRGLPARLRLPEITDGWLDVGLRQPRNELTREDPRYFELVTEVREALRGREAGPSASVDRMTAEGGVG